MPRESSPALEQCTVSSEALFVRADGRIAMNLHNHTTRSDGRDAPERLAEYAERHSVNLAITDHNIPPEPKENRMPPGLIAGMEVTTREGVDVVVIGTLAQVQQLFDASVRPALHPRDPRFSATTLGLADLLEAMRSGMHCLHPHYATTDGLSRLSPRVQADILQKSAGYSFVEINATRTAGQNALAQELAREWDMPTVYASDAHREEWQHAGTYSDVPRSSLETAQGSLVHRLMGALHDGTRANHTLARLSQWDRLRTGIQVVRKNSIASLVRLGGSELARLTGRMPAASVENIPRRQRGGEKLPIAA